MTLEQQRAAAMAAAAAAADADRANRAANAPGRDPVKAPGLSGTTFGPSPGGPLPTLPGGANAQVGGADFPANYQQPKAPPGYVPPEAGYDPYANTAGKVDTSGPFKNSPGQPAPTPFPDINANWDRNPWLRALHAIGAGSQAALRGTADFAGAPVDIPLAGAKLLGYGYNEAVAKPFGLDEFPNINFSLADTIANAASTLSTSVGAPPMTAKQMTPTEQAWQTPIEFGTSALEGGATLAGRGPQLAWRLENSPVAPSFADKLATPYINRPVAALARDAGAGVGAGAASDEEKRIEPMIPQDQPWSPIADRSAQIAATLFGGMAGSGGAAAASALPRGPKYLFNSRMPDNAVGVVNPTTGKPFTREETTLAAKVFQGDASNPEQAAANIKQNSSDLAAAGFEPGGLVGKGNPTGTQPTSALMSGDQGLVNLEQGFRQRSPAPFQERDQAVKGAAADKVATMFDPTANQSSVGPSIKNTVNDLKDMRDQAALPYLQAAQNAHVAVDAQPVLDLIDNQLAITKRTSVVSALTAARKALFEVGSDPKNPTLDSSVTGLYEARKQITDILAGKAGSDVSAAKFATKELVAVKDSIDAQINKVAPEFGKYLSEFQSGSTPLDAIKDNVPTQSLIDGKDPRDVATNILGGYGGADDAAKVTALVAGDPAASAGWKAAVGEVLVNRVTNSKVIDGSYEASYAALSREFKRNEDKLAAVFSPDEMANLQQAQKLLGYFKAGEVKATAGSDTATNLLRISNADAVMGSAFGRATELAMKHIYGNLEGGGIMRRFRLMAGFLPTSRDAATQVAKMAFFDPNVAAYLLGKPVKNVAAIPANSTLRRAIAADQQSESGDKGQNVYEGSPRNPPFNWTDQTGAQQ